MTGFPAERIAALHADLGALPAVLVAFSGGVDSGVLLAAAVRALGADRVVAATALSASLPAAERAPAHAFVRTLGVRHEQPATAELSRAGYVANAGDRCFFCKAELLDTLRPLAEGLGIAAIATGTNADDRAAGFRPGIRAAAQRAARTPLADAGMTKADVRSAARAWGLSLADKPAAACLSSRIAYGVPVSAGRLARVEAAEVAVRVALVDAGLPVRDLRVRDLGDVDGRARASVEIDADLVPRVDAGLLAVIEGFDDVELDPRGFRSGSMNELLPDPIRYR